MTMISYSTLCNCLGIIIIIIINNSYFNLYIFTNDFIYSHEII